MFNVFFIFVIRLISNEYFSAVICHEISDEQEFILVIISMYLMW